MTRTSLTQLQQDGWSITLQYLLVFVCLFWMLCKLFTILMHSTNSSFRLDLITTPSTNLATTKREKLTFTDTENSASIVFKQVQEKFYASATVQNWLFSTTAKRQKRTLYRSARFVLFIWAQPSFSARGFTTCSSDTTTSSWSS